jgi:hypothetical protein
LDINAKLRHFVDNPTAVRSCLGHYNGLISGCFALQFFERAVWPKSDLDLFFEKANGYEEMIEYLVQHEGYHKNIPAVDRGAYLGPQTVTVIFATFI